VRAGNSPEHSTQWRQTRRGLGNSRFALTILLAAAENLIIREGGTMEGAKEAEHLILDTVVRVRNVGHERRDQMVLEIVLDFYRSLHAIGDPDLDCELHMLILRHLGVIGTPLASAVLIRLTEFREYFARIGIETEVSRRRFIVRALNTMAYRGLIFRLDPHPRLVHLDKKNADWPAERDYRFALHRVVQSYALRHLNAGPNEPLHYNRFAPTLYAAMPSAGPRLSRSSYRFLRSLLIGLSQYPDIPANDQSAEPWLFTTRDTAVRVQAVRAALTMVRSNFSVAVVSRLGDADALSTGVQTRGNLETYRVRLRWIIRMAWELYEQTGDALPSDPTTIHNQVNVLYRDEIVWVYNELGVISLAQGSLSDALGYFRQAAEENERIEGLSRTAPIYNHIDLNHAIVQMERGNFQSARTRLERVIAATQDAKWRLYHLATGYLCVLDHLSGRREGVKDRFQNVCRFFQEHQEDRASAIMLMHFSRFVLDETPDEAIRIAQLARNLAQTSGHEDIRQHVELSAVRLRVRNSDTAEISANDLKTITEVEKFGKRMAIWSLQVDALWLRSRILLTQNETATAGRLLTRAMAIARRHSMTLRLNTCLTTYAEVLIGRRDFDGALSMANQSLDLAKRIGYSIETARAQNVISECLDNTSN
jgi:tetratricopeptide (TPR) repeat protein